MKHTYLTFVFLIIAATGFCQSLQVQNLRCEYRNNPMGVDAAKPRLSWQIISDKRNVLQTAYRILVADDSVQLIRGVGNVWDSKRVPDNASIQVPYNGKPLVSAKKYYWKMMMWDNQNAQSSWSGINSWQMGLLQKSDWKNAAWIGYDVLPDTSIIVPHVHQSGKKAWGKRPDVLPLLRKEFTISKKVKLATLFISGLGQFEASLNGQKIGDHFLDPGWTQYSKQALYVPFDITQQLQPGKNAIGVMLGNGFYYIPSERYRKMTGGYGYPKMICRMVVNYTDGTQENVVSDASWKTTAGPITFSSIYGGEDYDATKEQTGWNKPAFNDALWKAVIITTGPPQLNAQTAEPVKIIETFSPGKTNQPKPGVTVYDMGQNAAAIPYIEVSGKRGDTVKITPGELLREDGTVTQSATGGPHLYQYILKGDGVEKWHPQFTYYGFRYVQVETISPNGKSETEVSVVKSLHPRNAAERVGHFSCSNPLFNRTDTLIDWAVKSNMVSTFTDCPHREKLGWLEQDHLMAASLGYNYDIAALCRKIVKDMQMAQTPEGLIPEIAPEFVQFGEPFRDSPEWGSSCILLPWYLYQQYGDKQVLEESYPMMQRYIRYLQSKDSAGLLKQGLGDWYDIGPNRPGLSQNTPQGLTATAYYYYNLKIVSLIAHAIGKEKEALGYGIIAPRAWVAFRYKFFNDTTKQYGTGSQTANAIALYMGLVSPSDTAAVTANLVKDIEARNYALTAGDIGFRYVLQALYNAGRSDVIYKMNNRSDVPSYGYQLEKGATALTESWQALPSVSNNHLMLGHIQEWFWSGLAGIRQKANKIEIHPQFLDSIDWVKSDFESSFGRVVSNWKKSADGSLMMDITIPVNTTATIHFPNNNLATATESGKPFKEFAKSAIHSITTDKTDESIIVEIGSGNYHFKITPSPGRKHFD